MIDYLYEWFRYKTGKITLKEFEENTSVTKNLCRDFSKEKILGTIYFEEVKKNDR